MCVIAIKKQGVSLPHATMKDMFAANSDGCGFAVVLKDKTIIKKGLMTVKDLSDALKPYKHDLVVVHFRFATHGLKSKQMTHPFVVSPVVLESFALSLTTTKPVLIHNGIISGFGNAEISDTLDFTTRVLSTMPTTGHMIDLLTATGSKYVLIANGVAHTIGRFEDDSALSVSNTYYKRTYQYALGYKGYNFNSKNIAKSDLDETMYDYDCEPIEDDEPNISATQLRQYLEYFQPEEILEYLELGKEGIELMDRAIEECISVNLDDDYTGRKASLLKGDPDAD